MLGVVGARAFALVGLVLVATLGCTPPNSGAGSKPAAQGKPEQASVKVGILPGEDYLPLFVAQERGLFKQEGIDVEFVQFNAAPDVLSTLIAGQIDLGASGMTEVVTAMEAGQDVRSIWTLTRSMPYEIWGKSDFADLRAAKGARFAISKYGAISDFFTRYAAQKAGLDPYKDIQVVQIGGVSQRVAAVKGGSAEATILTRAGSTEIERAGFKRLAALKDVMPDFPFEVIYASQKTMTDKPNTFRAFFRGLRAAIPLADKGDKAAADDLIKYGKFKPEDAPQAVEGVKGTFPLDGKAGEEGVASMLTFLKQAGEIKNDYKVADLWDTRFMKEFEK